MKHERQRLLNNRGIGKKYHNMSLTDYPDPTANEIKNWIESEATDHLAKGNGVVFFSTKLEGYDLSVLTARALILSGYTKLRVIDFNFCLEEEVLAEIGEDKPPLLIMNFFPDPDFVGPVQYKRLESYLNYYIDNSIPLLLHIPADKEAQRSQYGALMSPVFFDRVQKNSKIFSI